MSELKDDTFEVMPPEVFRGGCGHIVLCQEHTGQTEEYYLRVMIAPKDAERVASEILAIARRAK